MPLIGGRVGAVLNWLRRLLNVAKSKDWIKRRDDRDAWRR